MEAIKNEGLLEIFKDAEFELREPGCSACLAMNDDKIPLVNMQLVLLIETLKVGKALVQEHFLQVHLLLQLLQSTGKITDPRSLI